MTPLDYENWLLDEQARSLLEHHYGWREPTWEDLRAEHQDRLDRISDFTPVAADQMTPRREPAPVLPSGRASVHHTQAPPQSSPPDAGGPGSTSPQGA